MINSVIKEDIYQTELRGFARSICPSVRPSRALVTVGFHSNAKAQPHTDYSNILADTI
jgi:hypothetical protein